MINTEKSIYIYEREIKPNKYGVFVLLIALLVTAGCWMLNEIGFFRVQDLPMRIGAAISCIALGIPLAIMLINRNQLGDPSMKYLVIAGSIIFTFITTAFLTFHTTIMILFPMFIAMLYRSRTIGIVAVIGSLTTTILSPTIGYLLGTWDVDFFRELIYIASGEFVEVSHITILSWNSIFEILIYITIPRVGMILPIAVLLFYVIKIGVKQIDQQVELSVLSMKDNLTGLYNRNYFDTVMSNGTFNDVIGLIYFDVNDLKKANDSKGHEYGDLLLTRCAESFKAICDDNSAGFRLGGDEFIIVVENATEEQLKEKHDIWEKALEKINEENITLYPGLKCEVASGYVRGHIEYLAELMKRVDKIMYLDKEKIKSKSLNENND